MWYYQGEEISRIEQVPAGAVGFVYKISFPEMDLHYIGKKNLHSTRTLPPLKGYKRNRRIQKESNWLTYCSSNTEVQYLVNQGHEVYKDILTFAWSQRQLTYLETKMLFVYSVLEDDRYMNGNILGKFYAGNTL
jgi:hypothetical protein